MTFFSPTLQISRHVFGVDAGFCLLICATRQDNLQESNCNHCLPQTVVKKASLTATRGRNKTVVKVVSTGTVKSRRVFEERK